MTTKERIQQAAAKMGVSESEILEASRRMSRGTATAADKRLLESLTPDQARPCGDCNMCCVAPAIESTVLDNDDENDRNFAPKPACKACQFSGKGCGIYADRPSVCRHYQCLWSLGLIPAVNYPMKRGVCWTFQPAEVDGMGIVVGHCLDVDAAMRDGYNINVISGYVAQRELFLGVTLRDTKQAVCFLANGQGARALIDPTDKMGMRIMPETEHSFTYKFA